MKYYYHPVSPNCRKVTAVIHHLGIDAEHSFVDLPKGEQMSPEFLAVNPNGRVPALIDGDRRIWESNAIIIYLAEKAASDLWPNDDRRLDILKWLFWEQGHLMYATGIPFYQQVVKPLIGEQPDQKRIDEAYTSFGRLAKVLDDQLAGNAYVVGDALSLADFAVAGNFSFASKTGLPMDELSNIRRWLDALDDIPAWADCAPPPLVG
jgi:glutathione S-transferase